MCTLPSLIIGNKIEDAGASALGQALMTNTALSDINLGCISILIGMWREMV